MISPPGGRRQAQVTYELAGILGRERRLLLFDLDPLARITRLCGIEPPHGEGVSDVLLGRRSLAPAIRRLPFFDVVPASRLLAAYEALARTERGRGAALERALQGLVGRYDLALFALPRESGRALWSAFLPFSDAVVLTVEPVSFGLAAVEATVLQIETAIGSRPVPSWIVALGFEERSPLARNFLVALHERWPGHLFETAVPDVGQGPVGARGAALRAMARELDQRLHRPLSRAPRPSTLSRTPPAVSSPGTLAHGEPGSPWTP